MEAVIWTDLPSNFRPTAKRVTNHLKILNASALKDAETYVRRTPSRIKTKIRKALENEYRWTFVDNPEERDWSPLKRDLKERLIHRSTDDSYWVGVPREPATFGHLIAISWKGHQEQDITDKGLFMDRGHIGQMIRTIHDIAYEMKTSLTMTGEADEKECRKVYLVSECETENFPFYFHLIPRFEGDKKGHLYLFQKELEEARWITKEGEKEKRIQNNYVRVAEIEPILHYHKWLLLSNKWARLKKDRKKFVKKNMKWWKKHSFSCAMTKEAVSS